MRIFCISVLLIIPIIAFAGELNPQQEVTVVFNVTLNTHIPKGEKVSVLIWAWNILGKPFDGEKIGANTWRITVTYDEIKLGDTINYVYCRNSCALSAQEAFGLQNEEGFRTYPITEHSIEITDTIDKWRWWPIDGKVKNIQTNKYLRSSPRYLPRNKVQCGVTLADWWFSWYEESIEQTYNEIIENTHANYIRYIQIITVEQYDPEPILKSNTSESEILKLAQEAKERGLGFYLDSWFFPGNDVEDTNSGNRDMNWWKKWFSQYRKIILETARLAESNEVDILGFMLTPSCQEERHIYPNFFNSQAISIIKDIRKVFSGSLSLWYEIVCDDNMSYYKDVDYFKMGIQGSFPFTLSNSKEPSVAEMVSSLEQYISGNLYNVYRKWQKPFIIDIYSFSFDGAVKGETNYEDHLPWGGDNTQVPVDLQEQADFSEAMFQSLSNKQWIEGIYSFAYLYCDLIDKSSSIRAKPAEKHVFKKWFKWINNDRYALTIDTTKGGTTNPAPAAYVKTKSRKVKVKAIPAPGYKFIKWKGNGIANIRNKNPIRIRMKKDYSIKAVFKKIQD